MAGNRSHPLSPLYRVPLMVVFLLVLLIATLGGIKSSVAYADTSSTITNFDAANNQITRYDTQGNAIDAHDGEIHQFGNTYYFYGTSYSCGYLWRSNSTPFCGFTVYSSTDLVHWTDHGTLFNSTTSIWQNRCSPHPNLSVYGNCFRPHLLYNASSKSYILWVKDYTAAYHFRVLSSTSPVGPFTELTVPTLAKTNGGDENLFADDNGTAYIVYTDRNDNYDLAIEQLNASYTSGTGKYIRLGLSRVEAPAMFKRNGKYYVQYSSPNCAYCGGTGTSYKIATSPLGTWSAGNSITSTSCGGQPTHVATIATPSGPLYLYQSDLWNKGAHNEALANYFWGPLSFSSNGNINSLSCVAAFHVTLSGGQAGGQQAIPGLDQSDGVSGFRSLCDVASKVQRLQTFTPSSSNKLSSVLLTVYQMGQPNAAVHLDVVNVNAQGQPTHTLSANTIAASSVGWSARTITITPNIAVTAGQPYGILIHSTTTQGCYGVAYNDGDLYTRGQELSSKNSGSSFAVETHRALKFVTTLHS